ncbi:TetR/AcrR family transcriptional regulator [Flavobacterium sp. MAH-1]|uniref:TetR/AcrR family transcriptional regulator n=1 Tax=Flavobacterium agri TaxID=2743471 RepID=A0A7Y8Y6R2_9FLAO|nr:TetR/AcrR family transcriptional regulator [Flavobacterium agri]NUY82191.1 TetR/AcrR family transcriptional regulator [Flavobacterium agri]NYA72215.1 TetR/AcrR family transcriptional regulator [Flavobacterium agri]
MGSKDRILRQKEETRCKILEAAYRIVKAEGWQGLNMRKIADDIEYTPPVIYEHFSNKDAILMEITKKGFLQLYNELKDLKDQISDPEELLEAMWMNFWAFAFKNREMYQVMFGVEMTCCMMKVPEAELQYNLFLDAIGNVMNGYPIPDVVKQKYFTLFSVVHGLISINIVGNGLDGEMNTQILKDAISGIIRSLKD